MVSKKSESAGTIGRRRHAASAPEEVAAHPDDPDFMLSLARGLAVIQSFAAHPKGMTMSRISAQIGISRASVRRCLNTLIKLGYVESDGQVFHLTPKVLNLGHAYSSSASLAAVAQPFLDRIRDRLHESCSLGVMDGDEVLYVARSETKRIISVSLRVGSRLPAYCTSMGRVLLAHHSPKDLTQYLRRTPLVPKTARTMTSRKLLLEALQEVRKKGYAVVDQELEVGLRSIAVAIGAEHTIGAINVGVQASRVPLNDLLREALPALREAAAAINVQLGQTRPI